MEKFMTDEEESAYFRSKQFIEDVKKAVDAATWDKGLPKIVVKDGWIVEHWKDGTIVKLKEVKHG